MRHGTYLNRFAIFLTILALATFSSRASATAVIPPDFATLVDKAEVIFRGEVTSTRSEWNGTGPSHRIVTFVTFKVLEAIKGTPPADYTLRMLGGTVNGHTLEVTGVPTFAVGDRTLLFVEHNGTQFFPVVGIMNGYFRLVTDAKTGAETVYRHTGQPLKSVDEIDEAHDRAISSFSPPSASTNGAAGGIQAPAASVTPAATAATAPLKTGDFEAAIRAQMASTGK